ncbi:hypothetical protein CY34DRAFT_800230 [Suillus luteus UH-Slu-Lm8-n1]|uniref:Uncharacterized protein n=1 Tax=Suillus luteus UH-Slu-Lm8-n1 TaxID=930992 RepID=A0A0D0BAF2_9AGAM|nr:hypothetical protein CY34DRAFT_800230 [Suillus luteus UH-Slu-Lm8-n1]
MDPFPTCINSASRVMCVHPDSSSFPTARSASCIRESAALALTVKFSKQLEGTKQQSF